MPVLGSILADAITLPPWAQYVILVSVLVTALGLLWRKVIRPGARLVTVAEQMLPLLQQLTAEFKDTPHAFAVLDEIVAQFRTDSGSSLRDVVNRLETAANENRAAAEVLKVGVEAQRQLAEQDRAQVRRLAVLIDRVEQRVAAGAATGLRIEEAAAGVADDLDAARKRADAASNDEAGAAADAAAQTAE